jgi:hypothetical protein
MDAQDHALEQALTRLQKRYSELEAKVGAQPADYDRSIHGNPDAQAWAKFFVATAKEQKWCIDDIDEGLMIAWFANAMMAMHDHVKREENGGAPQPTGDSLSPNEIVRPQNCGTGYCSCIECHFKKGGA